MKSLQQCSNSRLFDHEDVEWSEVHQDYVPKSVLKNTVLANTIVGAELTQKAAEEIPQAPVAHCPSEEESLGKNPTPPVFYDDEDPVTTGDTYPGWKDEPATDDHLIPEVVKEEHPNNAARPSGSSKSE